MDFETNNVESNVEERRQCRGMIHVVESGDTLYLIGKKYNCIIDDYDFDKFAYIGRNYMYAPDDVDGCIYIYSPIELEIGSIVNVEIIDASAYDLEAKLINIKKDGTLF